MSIDNNTVTNSQVLNSETDGFLIGEEFSTSSSNPSVFKPWVVDMHCHTSEGSLDARSSIFNIVDELKAKNYDGVLITDHNSYKGYETWKKSGRTDFKVFKGIEYDSFDAGHIIIILPENTDSSIFQYRGMRIKELSKKVHALGGILGPAHPFDHGHLGMCQWRRYKNIFKLTEVMALFDFMETFNACGSYIGNTLADQLAVKYNLVKTGGSDTHRFKTIGLGKTYFKNKINNNDDLITAIKSREVTKANGELSKKRFVRIKCKVFDTITYPYFLFGQGRAFYLSRKHLHDLNENKIKK